MKNKNSAKFNDVDDVFSRTANSYDNLCDFFSLYIHRYWKTFLAKKIVKTKGEVFLDIAAGTGDIALRVASRLDKSNHKHIILGDTCSKMLAIAKEKANKKNLKCEFEMLDVHNLSSIEDNSIDILSISFAMKICERDKVMSESYRVLKPGGYFYCLEAARIPVKWIHSLYLMYMRACIPIIAKIVTKGDKSAYNYLLKGIHDFPKQNELADELKSVGFKDVTYTNLTFGIVSLQKGVK